MTTGRLAVVVLAAAVLAAVAGCSASARPPVSHPAAQVTLACRAELPNRSLAADIALIAADDKAISGQWAAAVADTTGDQDGMTHPTVAQTKAADDLIGLEHDLGTAAQANGPIASVAGVLGTTIRALTGDAPTAAEGAAVHAAIIAAEQACGVAS